jgi:formylglycine-generating enzyme required for sulfatase activity
MVTEAAQNPTPTSTQVSQKAPGDTIARTADEMTMIYIPAGEFQVGSTEAEIEAAIELCRAHYSPCNAWYYMRESPLHTVVLDGFWIDQTEITNAQYQGCVDAGSCDEPITCKKGEPTYGVAGKSKHPVVCVSWDDAQDYCQWAGGRLPTEAEWEFAFRGESRFIYPWGDAFDGAKLNYCDVNCDQRHADNRYDDGHPKTSPVGNHPQDASWLGVLGMSGNVSEWVADWFSDYSPEASSNPVGPEAGSQKLVKGCSWYFHPAYCRGATRASVSPETRFDYLGFRCASSLKE